MKIEAPEILETPPETPVFDAVDGLFDAWERAVRELEVQAEEPRWSRIPNRQEKRTALQGRLVDQPRRSRSRRSFHRIARKKGFYK